MNYNFIFDLYIKRIFGFIYRKPQIKIKNPTQNVGFFRVVNLINS